MCLTDSQKSIYNHYLKFLRKGQPYRPRKDFSDIDANIQSYIFKIDNFLKRYSHIKLNEYFEAFSEIYPNDKYPNLNYFTTRAALKTYSLYKKKKEDQDPEKQFEDIKKSFQFIGMFCLENKIFLENYIFHKTGLMYSWLNHYREHRINPYCLMELGDILSVLDKIPKDELYLFSQNLSNNLVAFKTRYMSSIKTQKYVKEITQTVKVFIKKQLTNP